MNNLINSDVMRGLMSAHSSSKLQQVATKEYYNAKSRGDEGAMASSMGYATNFRDDAMSAVEEAGEALAVRAEEVREVERLEREQASRTAHVNRAQSVENSELATQTNQNVQSAIPSEQPAATLELSKEYYDYVQSEAIDEAEPFVATALNDTVKAHIPVDVKILSNIGKSAN